VSSSLSPAAVNCSTVVANSYLKKSGLRTVSKLGRSLLSVFLVLVISSITCQVCMIKSIILLG